MVAYTDVVGRFIYFTNCEKHKLYDKGKGKGKAIPLQARTGPEGSRKSKLPDFKTIST
jgi:hypothetical protein